MDNLVRPLLMLLMYCRLRGRRITARYRVTPRYLVDQPDSGKAWQIAQFGFWPVHPYSEGLADNIIVRNHAPQLPRHIGRGPVATVIGIVTVVTNHEVMPLGHGPFPLRRRL